jgi:hypothetical protein
VINKAAVVSKVHHLAIQNKQKSDATNKHPKLEATSTFKNSNFRFKSRKTAREVVSGAKKIAPRSVYVDSDAVRLYHAGKASFWHAGVLFAAPTVNAEE